VNRVVDWPYSSFHRHVRDGVYAEDWAAKDGVGDLDLE
jgi:putative transposase